MWFDLDFLATRSSRRNVFFSVSRAVSIALSCTEAGGGGGGGGDGGAAGVSAAVMCPQLRTRGCEHAYCGIAVVHHERDTHQTVQYLPRECGLLLDGAGHLFQPPHRASQLLYFVVQVVGGARLYVYRYLITGGRVAKQGLAGAEPRPAQPGARAVQFARGRRGCGTCRTLVILPVTNLLAYPGPPPGYEPDILCAPQNCRILLRQLSRRRRGKLANGSRMDLITACSQNKISMPGSGAAN